MTSPDRDADDLGEREQAPPQTFTREQPKVGCKGPTTYNACSTVRWNDGTSWPVQSGHGCLGCSEEGFWDKGSFYDRLTNINAFGVESNADKVGIAAVGAVGAAVAAHAAVSVLKRASDKTEPTQAEH